MECVKCGRTIDDHSIFCNWCGFRQIADENEINVPAPRKLSSGRWTIQLRAEGVSVTEDTEEEAILKARAIRAGFIEAKRKHQRMTPRKAIEQYVEKNRVALSPSTIRGYMTISRSAFPVVMTRDADQINWQAAITQESRRVSAKTLKNEWMCVSCALKFFGYEIPSVKLPKVKKPETEFLDFEQIQIFVREIRGNSCELGALLALHSLRRSEIFAVKRENVDIDKKTILVSGAVVRDENEEWIEKELNKTYESTRTVPIMIDRLSELIESVEGEYICPPDYRLRDKINTVCRHSGLPEVGIHGLRRSFASLAYHLGWSEHQTMLVGGWSEYKTMHDLYIKLAEKDKTDAIDSMRTFYNEY